MIETRMIRANGLNFEVDVAEPVAGDSARAPLALLLHGFPENRFSWRFQVPLLREMGYRVWAPNLRGYGRSSRPRGLDQYRIDHLLEDVAALIDEADAPDVTLAGHDWGGLIAWSFAIRRLRPLSRLIILNIPHPAVFRESMGWAQRLRSVYIAFFQLPFLPEWLLARHDARLIAKIFYDMAIDKTRFTPDVLDFYRDSALVPGALTAMLNYYRAFRLDAMKLESAPDVPVIETPTLMLWGEEDTALGLETTYGTDRYVRDLTFRTLPDVSHWVQQEAPEQVNALIKAWLSGQAVPQASGAATVPPLPHIPVPGQTLLLKQKTPGS